MNIIRISKSFTLSVLMHQTVLILIRLHSITKTFYKPTLNNYIIEHVRVVVCLITLVDKAAPDQHASPVLYAEPAGSLSLTTN